MPLPSTAGELQQFICATNWMRDSLIDYARVVHPVPKKLDSVLIGKWKTKRVASGISLQLDLDEQESFEQVKDLLGKSAVLACPMEGAMFCLFTDASDYGWAAIVTQVEVWQADAAITEQTHELLICKGGTFHGAQLHWSVIEKEAYPIGLSCDDLDYLLMRPGGFQIYCDHRNLIHLFAPGAVLRKHVRGKLLRWSIKLMAHEYAIIHIDGTSNLWADMISRWGGSATSDVTRFKRISRSQTRATRQAVLRPLDQDGFV
ncbi:hypothetical protein PI124_g16067 [Phytophthora idaei]|nr:hypothetical protein PI125_g16243 [Phytophthora idaei]KAG3150876.1 hypothetical protein PI126_g11264 [Phytophthora idaei]KAG3238996.1 hypothetical protein PI124_g16067 [Phytophthora idaei]